MIEDARLYAERKHGRTRRRDGPVIDHVRDVVANLQSLGVRDPYAICAAWLHDTIEGTDTGYDGIRKRFGDAVADMVSSLSKDTRLPREARAAEYAERLRRAGPDAKAVKLADIMTNLDSISSTEATKSTFHGKAAKLRRYLVAIRDGIDPDLPGLETAQKRLDALLRANGLEPVRLGSK